MTEPEPTKAEAAADELAEVILAECETAAERKEVFDRCHDAILKKLGLDDEGDPAAA